jgi:hypothetical protein
MLCRFAPRCARRWASSGCTVPFTRPLGGAFADAAAQAQPALVQLDYATPAPSDAEPFCVAVSVPERGHYHIVARHRRLAADDGSAAFDGDAEFRHRARAAMAVRRRQLLLPNDNTDAYRWVHGAADGLPGIAADVYGEGVAVSCAHTAAATFFLPAVAAVAQDSGLTVRSVRSPQGVYIPNDVVTGDDDAAAAWAFRDSGIAYTSGDGHRVAGRLLRATFVDLLATVPAAQRVLVANNGLNGAMAAAALRAGARRVTVVEADAAAAALCRRTLAPWAVIDAAAAEDAAVDGVDPLLTWMPRQRESAAAPASSATHTLSAASFAELPAKGFALASLELHDGDARSARQLLRHVLARVAHGGHCVVGFHGRRSVDGAQALLARDVVAAITGGRGRVVRTVTEGADFPVQLPATAGRTPAFLGVVISVTG